MRNQSRRWIVGVAFLLGGCTVGDEVTLYPARCSMPSNTVGVCGRGLVPMDRTTFRVSTERQEVIGWRTAGGPPERFTDCVVRDRRNWSCPRPAGDTGVPISFGIVDGEFRGDVNSPPAASDSVVYLNTFEWWLYKRL